MELVFSRPKAKKKLQGIAAASKSAQSGLCHTILASGQILHTLAYLGISWHILALQTNSIQIASSSLGNNTHSGANQLPHLSHLGFVIAFHCKHGYHWYSISYELDILVTHTS